jgi:hypothetical protein
MVGTLPAGGLQVWAREPAGVDELFVLESGGPPRRTIRELVARLVTGLHGEPLDWEAVPAVDLAAAALLIRRLWIGATITADAHCPETGCGGAIDITFSTDDYLDHRRPQPFRGVSEADGWFALADKEVRFRVPTVADLDAALGSVDPAAALSASCIRPASAGAAVMRRVERALDRLAPPLEGILAGVCPLCGGSVELWFEPIEYVLAELREEAAGLFDQVHDLARAYHWSEAAILRLHRRRRHGYVALVRAELAA